MRRIFPSKLSRWAVLALLAPGGPAVGQTGPTQLTAAYSGSAVRVAWTMPTGTNADGYDLYRRTASDAAFLLVAHVVPTSQRRYHYLDADVPAAASGEPITYQLVVHAPISEVAPADVSASAVGIAQRSWDTIKLMFR